MDISSVTSSAVATVAATAAPAAKASDGSATPSASATDNVTLSAAAQQLLATASDTQVTTTPPPSWTSDAVTTALAALNDTSGKTALADQIGAYKTLAAMVADAGNFDPTNPKNAKAVDVATAFSTSAFVQHYDELAAQFGAFNQDQNSDHFGTDLSDMQQRQLNYVNSLSASDQQTLMETYDASLGVMGSKPAFGSLTQYQATKQASIDVSRAMEALVASPPYADAIAAHKSDIDNSTSDVVTATVAVLRQKAEESGDTQTLDLLTLARGNNTTAAKAYFDKYGPAPVQSDPQKAADAAAPLPASSYKAPTASTMQGFFEDVTTLADTSGKASPSELVDAYKNVWGKASTSFLNSSSDVFWLVGWTSGMTATGAQRIQQTDNAWNAAGWAGRGGSHASDAQSYYTAFEKLSDSDQQLMGALRGTPWNTTPSTGTPDDFRAQLVDGISNAAQGDALDALYRAQTYGHLTAKSTVTILGVTLNLNSIMASDDKRLDPYTRMSSDVKALLKDAAEKWAKGEKVSIDATHLNGTPPSDAEKALTTLKAYAAGTAPQSDDDKALAKLKNAAAAGDTAAVTLLKDAAEARAKTDADKADAEHKQNTAAGADNKTATTASQAIPNTMTNAGAGLSVHA